MRKKISAFVLIILTVIIISTYQYKIERAVNRLTIKYVALLAHRAKINIQSNNKFFAHKVNSFSSLKSASLLGFKNIEIDIYYDENENDIFVGHYPKELSKLSLRDFLKDEHFNFEKIWLDFKNLTEKNLHDIEDIMESINLDFNLKKRTLFESSLQSESLSIFSDKGWHVSYYYTNQCNLESCYGKLIDQLRKQKVKSISFDYSSNYKDIKSHLLTNKDFIQLNLELSTWIWLNASSYNFESRFNSLQIKESKFERIIIQNYEL